MPDTNQLLGSLSQRDSALIKPYLEEKDLAFRQQIEGVNRKIRNIYFLESGLASVVAISSSDRRQTEIGMIGFEGMTGLSVVLGADRSPNETFMQVAGTALCLAADRLRSLLSESASLARSLTKYAHVFGVQAGQTALANADRSIEERLCRWLLMSHDRLRQEDLSIPHEFLSLMVGMRRPGVTLGLQRLESRGLVTRRRGGTLIVDRAGLRELANGLYGVPEAEYKRLIA